MANRHNSTQANRGADLVDYFRNPTTQRQKQYEAVRALVLEKRSVDDVSKNLAIKPAPFILCSGMPKLKR